MKHLALRWGEVIPLWFFRDLTAAGVKVVIFSNPLSRSKSSPGFKEITSVGSSVSRFMNSLKERVLYVVSGDLAHSHTTDCTTPLYRAGGSKCSLDRQLINIHIYCS